MSEEVRANRFVVVDENGNERAILGMGSQGVALELRAAEAEEPGVALQLADDGLAQLTMTRGKQRAEIKLTQRNATVRLFYRGKQKSSCSMTLDHTGAWLVAEATHDIGVRILCRNDETSSSVWLSETFRDGDETCTRTRFLRPDPAEDKSGAWRSQR